MGRGRRKGGEILSPAGKPGRTILRSVGGDGGRKASGEAHESSGVGDEEGAREASGVAENPQGSRQGVGGGVNLPQGTSTPKVAELPRGDKTPRVTTAGEGEPGEDGRGRGGDENPPTTRATVAQGANGSANKWMGGPRMAPPPRPQRGTAADNGSTGTLTRHTAGTDGARP